MFNRFRFSDKKKCETVYYMSECKKAYAYGKIPVIFIAEKKVTEKPRSKRSEYKKCVI